jgi:2-amino-4-hydroxy-6-hydroxymethyldihydropteridine diphosphokinase
MAEVYIGVGSNLGDRRASMDAALRALAEIGTLTVGSPIYETDPVGVDGQDAYLNAVIGIETTLTPSALLERILAIEAENGRVRDRKWDARTLDMDILWYDGINLEIEGLTIPHPRIRERRFVLAPLVEAVPGLGDDDGPYAVSLSEVSDQHIEKISGPVDRVRKRWRDGLWEALAFETSDTGYSVRLNPDWENRSHAMFGGFLCAAALVTGGTEYPDMFPASLTYRFLRALPAGGRATIEVEHDRRSSRSAEMTMSIRKDNVEYGRVHMSVVSDPGSLVAGVAVPDVLPIHECVPIDLLVAASGDEPGNSIRSWRPLERWDIPDLVDGSTQLLRAWCPNPVAGATNAYLSASSLLMPIDALIWPATMLLAGRLPNGPALFTPTIELSARFPDTESIGFWHVGEAQVDHLTTKGVSGTVKVWSEDGRHCATGHSLNRAIG